MGGYGPISEVVGHLAGRFYFHQDIAMLQRSTQQLMAGLRYQRHDVHGKPHDRKYLAAEYRRKKKALGSRRITKQIRAGHNNFKVVHPQGFTGPVSSNKPDRPRRT